MTYGRLCEPRISVVICNFNYAQFVGSAIKSVLAQTRPAFELVVVDDGSTDTSVDVIQPFVSKGVCLIRQANGGQIAAYNTGFAQTQGDVILFLDADDLLLPEALDEVAKKFIDGIVKVHFRLELVGPLGQVLGSTIPRHLAIGEVASRLVRKGVPHASPPASVGSTRSTASASVPTVTRKTPTSDFFW